MKEKLAPFQTAILIYMIQSGVVFFSLPRLAAEAFGTNGWLGILFVYIIVTVNLLLIWYVFKVNNGKSMLEIMGYLPTWIRLPIYLILISIWLCLGSMVLVKFSMLLKMLFFPDVKLFTFYILGLSLCFMLIKDGIYHIAKATVVLFFFTFWTVFLLVIHIQNFSFVRLTPFIFEGEKDIVMGGLGLYTSMLGYELSLLFLHNVEEGKLKALIMGNSITTIIYIGVCVVCFGFFSFEHLLQDLYPVVTLLEYISFPVVERIENLIFSLFGLKVIVTVVMYLWASKEVVEKQFNKINPKLIVVFIITASFFISLYPKIMRDVDRIIEVLAYAATGVAFLLPLLLLVIAAFSKKNIQEQAHE